MDDIKLIDILWLIKEGKLHPNRAYKQISKELNLSSELDAKKEQLTNQVSNLLMTQTNIPVETLVDISHEIDDLYKPYLK